MKRTLIAVAALAFSAATVSAAQVTFRGVLQFTAVTQACLDAGDGQPGEVWFMRFSPPNLGTNGPSTRLTLFYELGGAASFTLASGSLVGATFKNIETTGIFRGVGSSPATMRLRTQVPAAPTDTTTAISITGDTTDFTGDAGCTVSFIAKGFKQ